MNGNSLPGWIRVLMILCGISLVATIFVPLWRIDLEAPQYPEGLMMLIYASKVGGQVDIINGLNHYIGMKEIHTKDFIEFKILPYLIGFFSLLFLLVGVINKKKFLYVVFALFLLFGIIAMYDFWLWEYEYGHNLNPNAAIIVPGMSYQPPLIGYKVLLNFVAYSYPAIGGWIFISVGVASVVSVFLLWKNGKKVKQNINATLLLLPFFFSSCSSGPDPIIIGKDYCQFCKMTITSKRFGAEIFTKKHKAIKFDDYKCLNDFAKMDSSILKDSKIYITDFIGTNQLIEASQLFFLHSEMFRSPMGGNIAAFSNQDSLKSVQEKFNGNFLTWQELQTKL